MKTYRGFPARTPKGGFIVTVEEGNRKRDLPPKNNLRNHSPNGFNWGYGGSGPAQLSLALCCDVLGDDDLAQQLYQDYKWTVVSKLAQDKEWSLMEDEIRETLEFLKKDLPAF